jgi:ferredoxin
MNLKYLKPIRVVVSLIFFAIIALLFLDISNELPKELYEIALYLQMIPAFVKGGITGFAFFAVIMLTFSFGRVYCSSICPLGTYQDIVSRIGMKFRKRKKYKHSKPQNILRYSITAATFISFLAGTMLVINLLDPYSMFGKIFFNIFRPFYIFFNNLLADIFSSFGAVYLHHADMVEYNAAIILVVGLMFALVTVMALFRGRLYCNTICPVGGLLSLISKMPFYRLDFKEEACTVCGACATVCKAECIDIKHRTLDFTRCVSCYNCLTACPENSFEFKSFKSKTKPKEEEKEERKIAVDMNRRKLLSSTTALASTAILSTQIVFANPKNTFKERKGLKPVVPPGSKSIKHYSDKCIGCQLCVSACPTGVIQQRFYNDALGFMQPRMDYIKNYCTYECIRCGDICPTDAISPMTFEEKKTIQIGYVELDKHICIVFSDGTDCGACSEHCPTKAVDMVPWRGIRAPEINPEICVGCGACEYACPTIPYKAIYVISNEEHKKAKVPVQEKLDHEYQEDFPF